MRAEEAVRLQKAFDTVRRYGRRENRAERCALCGQGIGEPHPHLLELSARRLVCACESCAVLCRLRSNATYKEIPQRVTVLEDFAITDAQWDGLMIPIGMAFLFRNSQAGRMVCIYPGPGGATESLLPLEFWQDIASGNAALANMEADVEALLVNRLGANRGFPEAAYYLLPIDQCYRLVGLMRTHWRGLSGGSEVWQRLSEYFAELRERALSSAGRAYA